MKLPKISKEASDKGKKIIKTFGDFGVKMKMEEIQAGPMEVFYVLRLLTPTRMKDIENFQKDLTHSLGTEKVKIEAPIRNKPFIGVSVENKEREFISWKEIIKNKDFQKNKKNLVLPIGRTLGNEDIFLDFFDSPHLLIGGCVHSGKSTFLVSLIASLMTKFDSDELKLILADPKRVEFTMFSGSPYVLREKIYNAKDALDSLDYLVGEMENRYRILQDAGVKNLLEYNEKSKDKLPYIFFIADEIADFMVSKERGVRRRIDRNIIRLAQMSRAVGIQMIIATQRICAETLSGLILANLTNRMGFQTATSSDSRWLLDRSGAEELFGDGDGLFFGPEDRDPRRVQTPSISEKEIKDIILKSK